MATSQGDNTLVISYLTLRRALGMLGLFLPVTLVAGNYFLSGRLIELSISAYYYTVMRDVFVGIMVAVGLFLFSYKGYELKDNLAGHLGCLCAIGVSWFPTSPAFNPTAREEIIGMVHLGFAAVLFLTFAYFALALFTKTDPNGVPTPRKKRRNVIYYVCGVVILLCITGMLLIGVFRSQIAPAIEDYAPVFWLESIAVLAFGFSWLVKGETLWQDEN